MAVELLLSLLGIGVGASTIHPVAGTSASPQSLGIGSAIWFFVTTLIAFFVGGWAAGRLARRTDAPLHALAVWGIGSVAIAWLLTTAAGGAFSGATQFFRGALGLATNSVAANPGIVVSPQVQAIAARSVTDAGIGLFITIIVSAFTAWLGGWLSMPRGQYVETM